MSKYSKEDIIRMVREDDVEFIREIWKQNDFITLLYEQPFLFLLNLLKWAVIIYAAGLLAYACYSALARWIRRYREKTPE